MVQATKPVRARPAFLCAFGFSALALAQGFPVSVRLILRVV
jgi:hypothetical protein